MRSGVPPDATQATGTAERDTVPVLVDQAKERGFHPKTLGGGKAQDGRSSAIDGQSADSETG